MMSGKYVFFFFQAEDGIRDLVRSRGLGDVYKRQALSEVIRRGINARLLVVGNGKERFLTELQRQVKDLSLIHI